MTKLDLLIIDYPQEEKTRMNNYNLLDKETLILALNSAENQTKILQDKLDALTKKIKNYEEH